ncbi:hypothetical protein C8J57DRAFT_1471080 [Mycena rebaudengoi]|nr:hypothetical protein C8J57DRAFT_1471080 [Mycena rebaudengoi]
MKIVVLCRKFIVKGIKTRRQLGASRLPDPARLHLLPSGVTMPKGCGVNERGTQPAIVEVRQKNGERRDGGDIRAAGDRRKESGPDSPVPAAAGAARRAATAIASSSPPTLICPATLNQSPTPSLLPQSSQVCWPRWAPTEKRALRRDGWWCGCGVRGYTRCGYREDGRGLSTERPQGIARKYHRPGANWWAAVAASNTSSQWKIWRRGPRAGEGQWAMYLRGSGYGEPSVVGLGHTALRTHASGSQDTAYARLQPYGEIAASVPQVVTQHDKMSPTVLGDARWDWRIAAFWPSKAQAAWTRAGSGAEVSGGGGRRAPGPRGRDEGAIPIQREWRASSAWPRRQTSGVEELAVLLPSQSSDPSKCRGRRGELGVAMVTKPGWTANVATDRARTEIRPMVCWEPSAYSVYRVEKLDGDGARADSWAMMGRMACRSQESKLEAWGSGEVERTREKGWRRLDVQEPKGSSIGGSRGHIQRGRRGIPPVLCSQRRRPNEL